MESAIPKPLVCPRTHARRIADNFEPGFPAWTARTDKLGAVTVMAYFGVQFSLEAERGAAIEFLNEIATLLSLKFGCAYRDFAYFRDQAGFHNFIAIAYWLDNADYWTWTSSTAVAAWWDDKATRPGAFGFFREVLSPTADRFETLFSSPDQMEGVGIALGRRSEEDIQEHSYWGSMRDRLPCAQTDPLDYSGALSAQETPDMRVIRIAGHRNIALIRSGQDWTETRGKERSLYLEGIEPILRKGMNFLSDEGKNIGCYVNRYVTCVDLDGFSIEKSFGLSYWRSLKDMEAWAEHHPTHLRIFGSFMQTVQELNFQLDLRLYHEVTVLNPDQQFYEYVNCHDQTGLINGLSGSIPEAG